MGLADWRRGRSVPDAVIPDAVELDGPAMFDDPYPFYAGLRRTAPIVPVRSG